MDEFEKKITEIKEELQASGARIGFLEDKSKITGEALEMWVLKQTEVEALLLLAEQAKRIADVIVFLESQGGLRKG